MSAQGDTSKWSKLLVKKTLKQARQIAKASGHEIRVVETAGLPNYTNVAEKPNPKRINVTVRNRFIESVRSLG